jgi:hypothetical protein
MQTDKRLLPHEANLVRPKLKKTAFHIIFGGPAA